MPLIVHAKKIMSTLIASDKPLNIDQIINAIVPTDFKKEHRPALRRDFRATLNVATRLGFVHNLSNYYFTMRPIKELDDITEKLELVSEPEDDGSESDEICTSSSSDDVSVTSSSSSNSSLSDSSLSDSSSAVLKNLKETKKSERCHKLKIPSDLECSSSSLTLPSEMTESSDCEADSSPYMQPWQDVE